MNEYDALVADVASRGGIPDLVDLVQAAELGFDADQFADDVANHKPNEG